MGDVGTGDALQRAWRRGLASPRVPSSDLLGSPGKVRLSWPVDGETDRCKSPGCYSFVIFGPPRAAGDAENRETVYADANGGGCIGRVGFDSRCRSWALGIDLVRHGNRR